MSVEERIKSKLIEKLDMWCVTYMMVGTSYETPRYSQVLANEDYTSWSLKSTISSVYYNIEWEVDELAWFRSKQIEQSLWNWWRNTRTSYLKTNYPTINPL